MDVATEFGALSSAAEHPTFPVRGLQGQRRVRPCQGHFPAETPGHRGCVTHLSTLRCYV